MTGPSWLVAWFILLLAALVIAATSKRIWDSGYEAGKEDTFLRAFGHKPIPNPYRSVNE